jgi:hypothetical protein
LIAEIVAFARCRLGVKTSEAEIIAFTMCRLGVKTMRRFDFQFAPAIALYSFHALQVMQPGYQPLSH